MGDIYTTPPQSRNEAILRATIDGTEYTAPPQSRIEDLLIELKAAIEQSGGGTTVVANPEGEATDEVKKLQVGSTVYAVEDEAGRQLLDDTVGWTGKNLLPNNATSQTINDVAFMVNEDGSISTSGTATSDWVIFDIGNVTLKSGTYKFNGCNGGSVNTYRLVLSKTGADVATLYDGENEFTLEENTEITARIIVRYTNVNMNGKVFYPMISKDGGAYEPYHASVEESKVDNSVIAPVEDGTAFSQAYSIGQHFTRHGAFCTLTANVAQNDTILDNTPAQFTAGDVASNLFYKAGDTISIRSVFAGYLTSSSKRIEFSIPLNRKPIISAVAFTGNISVRTIEGYAINNQLVSNYTITLTGFDENSLWIRVTNTDESAFTGLNNTPIAVTIDGTITFS